MPDAETYQLRAAAIKKGKSKLAFSLDKPLLTVMCTFNISILPRVLSRIEVWLFTISHIVFFVLKAEEIWLFDVGNNGGLWAIPLSMSALGIPAGLMSLLLVFFNSQCFARYGQFYAACNGMGGTVQELAQLSAAHVSGTAAAARWDACRYLLASVMMVYMKATDLAKDRPPKVDPEDWDRLIQSEEEWLFGRAKAKELLKKGDVGMPPLLDGREMGILKKCPGRESHVLQMWALETMKGAYKAADADHHFREIEDSVLTCRRNCATIPNMLGMPIPFPYYHLLCCLMFVNYALFSITFLEMDSWLTPVALLLIIIVTTGVRELSSALANPFGDDEVDFNSSQFIHKIRGLITFLAHPSNAANVQLPYIRGATYSLDGDSPPTPTAAAFGAGSPSHVDVAFAGAQQQQQRGELERELAQQKAELEQLKQLYEEKARMEELQGMIAEQQQQQQQQQMMMMQMAQSQQQRPTSELERELHDQHEQIRELKAKIGSPRATAAVAPSPPLPPAAPPPSGSRKVAPIPMPAANGAPKKPAAIKPAAPAVKPVSVSSALPSYELAAGQEGSVKWRAAPAMPQK